MSFLDILPALSSDARHVEFSELDIEQLSPFTLACVTGQIAAVKDVCRYLHVTVEMLTHQSRQSMEGALLT